MNKKVNISAINSKMHFIYKDEREKNIAAIVIYNKDGKFFFDPEYKNEMSNLEVEALLLRGALVDRDGKYYRPSSFNENNVSFSDAVINPEDIEVDLSGYATKDELNTKADINDIPIKVSDLQNDSNFLSSIPSEYVTDTELNQKGYLTEHQSLNDYATKTYVTSEIANAQLSGGEVDLSGYATKDELKDAIDAIEINPEDINQAVKVEIENAIANGDITNMTIDDNSITPEKTAFYKNYNMNLLDVNDPDAFIDKDYSWDGILSDSEGGTVYDIPVKANQTYYFNKAAFNPSSYYGLFLDENKTYINSYIMGKYGSNDSVTTPDKCAFIRIRVDNSMKNDAYLSEKNTNEHYEYNTIEWLIDGGYSDIFKNMYENLLSESFIKQSVFIDIYNDLNDEIANLRYENSKLSNGVNDMHLCVGNHDESHPITFKKGYIYKLSSASDWCNKNSAVYDCIDNPLEVWLKGHYNIKAYKDGVQVLPGCGYVNTASLYPITNYIKNRNDILFLGDSLTDPSFQTYEYNYVSKLEEKYRSFYNFIPNIANFGHTAANQLTSFNSHCSAMKRYFGNYYDLSNISFVSIFLGTNEIGSDVPISQFESDYVNLIDSIQTNLTNAKILLITPALCYKKETNINYIDKVKEIGLNRNIEVVDLSVFEELNSNVNGKNDYYLEDECVHFTKKGWDLINPTIIKGFEKIGITV